MRAQAPIVCLLLPVPRFLGAPAPLRWHVPFPLRRVALPSRRAAPLLPARPRPRAAPRRPHLPNPIHALSARVGLLRLGRAKLHDFYAKVRNYCVKHADFLPNSPSSHTALHTLPIGIVTLACTPPGTIRTENLRKTPSSPLFPFPPHVALARSAPFANHLQKRRFRPRFRGQKRAKKQPTGAFLPASLAQNG